MIFLNIILNRIYIFLTRVQNQSPFFGAICLVTLLIYATINNVLLLVFAFRNDPVVIKSYIDCVEFIIILLMLYYYAINNQKQIVDKTRFSGLRNNLMVGGVYLFTLISFIFLANINRKKIAAHHKWNILTADKINPWKVKLESGLTIILDIANEM